MRLDSLINAFVTLFVIIEPVALAPVFLGITAGFSADQRRQVAWRGALIAFVILTLCAFFGQPILAALGISLPAFRISGGVLLFWIAWQMIFGNRAEDDEQTARAAITRDHIENVAAFPLAIPLLAGPGAITAVMLLAGQMHDSALAMGALIAILAGVVLLCWIAMLVATPVTRLLGTMGNIVVARLLGVVLAALSVQFVIDGALAIIRP